MEWQILNPQNIILWSIAYRLLRVPKNSLISLDLGYTRY